VRTFSTDTGLERTNSANLFELPITPFVAGDFNDDGLVNLADYTVWRDNLGASDESALNGNGNMTNGVDVDDYELWKTNFGPAGSDSLAVSNAAVPEPGTLTLLGLLVAAGVGSLRRHRSVSN
jgi:hypothetical protein